MEGIGCERVIFASCSPDVIVYVVVFFLIICIFFFFSSRRRHTRWTGDWSSDVCSSDLEEYPWPVDHRGCQRELFLHAMRIVRDEFLRLAIELHEFEELGGALGGSFAVETVHPPGKIQVLGAREPPEKGHAFGNDAYLPFDFDAIRTEI